VITQTETTSNVAGFATIPQERVFIQEEFPERLSAATIEALCGGSH